MKAIRNSGLFISLIVLLAACDKVTYRKTAGGMPYKLYKGNDSTKITGGNFVKYHVKYVVNDSVYFNSFGKLPVYALVSYSPQPYDIGEVWTSLNVGDSIVTSQMIDTFLKKDPTLAASGRFKKGERIVSYIKVLGVLASDSLKAIDEQAEQKKHLAVELNYLENYLASKNIKAVKTASGALVEVINPGTGALIDSGKYVSVNYTGTSFSGKKFDSNTDSVFKHVEPLSFVVGTNSMIKGFDEAMRLLRPGASARVYIPSMLGFGANPDPRSGIKPFEHIIFDLVVVDVKDKAPEMRPGQNPVFDPRQPNR